MKRHQNQQWIAELLRAPGPFAGAFSKVVFAVYDRSESQATYEAFAEVFRGSVRTG